MIASPTVEGSVVPGRPKLSVCIPTFNFGAFIGATLASIVNQETNAVEVVVLDGGSDDDTAQIVRGFQAGNTRVRFEQLRQRGGIDRDMARVVELATGEYCWLFSADDLMKPGSIHRVLQLIASGDDAYLCKHTMCTLDMKILGERAVLARDSLTRFDLHERSDRQRYFMLALTTEAFFSFMGGLIIKKDKWDSVPLNESFVGSCWAHAARMFELMEAGLRLTYVPEALLDRRGDNDSFADRGVVNRYRIAIDGYNRIAAVFCGSHSAYAFQVRRTLRNEFGLRMFLYARVCCWLNPEAEDIALLRELIRKTYSDVPIRQYLVLLACRLLPVTLYARLRGLYRRCAGVGT
jgi:abequosyltransferase